MAKQQNETASKDVKKEERVPFKIELDQHIPFNGVAESKYITSMDFLHLISVLFKNVYADFEGCVLDSNNTGDIMAGLIFNHGRYDEGDVVACERFDAKTSGSTVIDKMRFNDRQMTVGDRYVLTQDGVDGLAPLVLPKYYKNGKPNNGPNWGTIVGEWTEAAPQSMYTYQQPVQYTKVSGISLERICSLLYGTGSEDDGYFEYGVKVVGVIPNPFQTQNQRNANYVFLITKASKGELENVYRKLGFGNTGSSIIRA